MQSFNLLRCIQKLWIQLFSWTQWIIYMMPDIAGTVFLNKDTARISTWCGQDHTTSHGLVGCAMNLILEAVGSPPQVVWSCQRLEEHLLITCCVFTTCFNFTCGRGWGCVWCCCQYWGICRIRKYCDHQCHKMYHQTCHQFHQWIWWFTEIVNLKTCHKLHHRIWWFTEKAPILSQNLSLNVVIHFIYHQIWW